jgi:hypothetical protein
LIEHAQQNGLKRVYLGSQKHAASFYEKLGFQAYGEEFVEAGIAHISMEYLVL